MLEMRESVSACAGSLFYRGGGWGLGDCWVLMTICRSVSSVFHYSVKLQSLQNHPVFLLQWEPSASGHRRDDIVNGGKIQ